MSLGTQLNAIESSLERLFDEIRLETTRAAFRFEKGALHEDAHRAFVQVLSGFEDRLGRLTRALKQAEGQTRGRALLAKHAPRGDARYRATQSAKTHGQRRQAIEEKARLVTVDLQKLAIDGTTPTFLDVANGMDSLGKTLEQIMGQARNDGDTVILHDAGNVRGDMASYQAMSPGSFDVPLSPCGSRC